MKSFDDVECQLVQEGSATRCGAYGSASTCPGDKIPAKRHERPLRPGPPSLIAS